MSREEAAMRIPTTIAALLGLILAACGSGPHEHYVLDVVPRGDVVERRLTCWHAEQALVDHDCPSAPFPRPLLEEIAAVYGVEMPAGVDLDGKYAFSADFRGAYRNELDGSGHYARYVTPLGTVGVWSETYRGEADPLAARRKRERVVDRFVEFLVGFVRHEVGEGEEADVLADFLRTDLRDDVLRVLDLMWLGRSLETAGFEGEEASRRLKPWFGRFLVERGYLDPIQTAGATTNLEAALRGLARVAARRLGWKDGEPLPGAVTWLFDNADERFAAYCETLPVYRERLRAWEAGGRMGAAPDPSKVAYADLAYGGESINLALFDREDRLELTLHLPLAPLETTGDWDEGAGVVRWERELPPGFGLPLLCEASWAVPDAAWQERHLGRVVLEGVALADYCRAQALLPDEAAERWTAFLEGLEPAPDLAGRIGGFAPEEEGLAEVRRILVGALADSRKPVEPPSDVR